MRDMADELLKLYAERKMAEGFAFSPDSNWQREFEDAFEYTATRDQLQAVTEIKRDMESPQPMDRLLCGDVGFGKTEVAMRAAFKALGDGKQVAVLAPTTVLAFQHFETFKTALRRPSRCASKCSAASARPRRSRPPLEDLAAGKVDIVIGTHRLLSKDVEFHDLGLLVVDEEQRFGVRHKERLKQIRKNVDVLTMSATPIPRTLHMSLLGLRDMCVIETPPKDRLAIQTVVAKFNPDLIKTAIEQEIAARRPGLLRPQPRRLHLEPRRRASRSWSPNARVGVGHGQMGEDGTGKGPARLHAPRVRRLRLHHHRRERPRHPARQHHHHRERAELRPQRAVPAARPRRPLQPPRLRLPAGAADDGELTEVARKRLAALKEFSDLGAGFKIAALDLELRGAGNLLGGEQHGHIGTVGYETYVKLLDETARELRGEKVAPEIHSSLNLGLEIRIPTTYIADEQQRLRAYKRIADAGEPEKAAALLSELEDRYGQPPESVRHLVEFSQLKTLAARCGIETIDRRAGGLNIKFHPGAAIDPHKLMRLVSETPGAQFTPAGVLRIPIPPLPPGDLLAHVRARIAELAS